MNKLLRSLDLGILAIIALISISLTIVDFFKFGEQNTNYPFITLFLLSTIALHLIVAYFLQQDFHGNTLSLLQRISEEVNVTDFRVFSDSVELETYLAKRMLEAKNSICDLSWKAKISEGFSASSRQVAHAYMDKCIAEASDRIAYREIFMFNDSRRIDKLERRLKENKSGYSCRYFKENSSIPRLQFVIVDDEEVLFFASSPYSPLCAIRNQELCRVFRSYYETTWNSAIPIKDGLRMDGKQISLIRNLRKNI
ncbi:hypothetical protein [Phormidium tenue]|uniref:Uncharacterized protein n=1 Tax=Phormidium tenue NIES-30 TaxID=549789 RepID=A0A1U7IY38_9CYAN|nr:hypothetical protein [Phormidium tenue]MBD2234915.1 hypothetical protein [Phormidium tenue FACHB-1052]OKH43455.1 hypothetical protein NIES30_24915 [Phormidium tenue NIES-30]